MKNLSFVPFLLSAAFALPAHPLRFSHPPSPPAPDFTVTTSDGQVKKLYQDYVNQQKILVVEAFFTTCPPCNTHAPLLQTLYTSMQAAHPGQVEFMLLSTLITDSNVKVADYKIAKGLTMPAVGQNGGSITALQPYMSGQWGPFQGTPTFFIIAPGSGTVFFDIRGNTPAQTMALLQQKIEQLIPKECQIENPFGTALDPAQIRVEGPAFDTTITAHGTYDISQIAPLQNTTYTLTPKKTGDPYDGLTTYDLVLMSKHILGIEPLLCPWQIVAADVNCTGSITTFDIVLGRKVILGIVDTLPCGAWHFVPESASVSNGNCQDFVGVKLGDVNFGPCNDSLAAPSDSRSLPQNLLFQDPNLQPGETARVPFFFGENVVLDGFQFAFEFDPNVLKINAVETETLEGFGLESYSLGEGKLAVSWLFAQGQRLAAESPLLSLEFSSPIGGRLSDMLQLSQSGLAPETYGSDGRIRPLQLSWLPPGSDFFISPNPAHSHFTLRANTLREGEFLVQMLDVQGKPVVEKTFTAQKGANSWEIEMPTRATGLYFLKVNGVAVGKVVGY